jgi:cell wall-associated NlpC family hydrolase
VAYARVLAPARRALVVTVAVLFAVAGLGTHADAAPSPADIEAQINQQWATLEPLVEQYNMVHSELQQNQAKSDALATQMRPLQLRVGLIMNRVGTMSASLYEHGQLATVSAMLSGSPGTLADRMTTLNVLAQRQTDTVRDAAALISQYNGQKKPLDALIATEGKLDADLAAKKTTIETQMAALQTLRQQAYGSSGNAGGALRPVACPFVLGTGKGAVAAKTACQQIGKPYVWAAAGPKTFDCSGLTLYAWAAAGVTLRHYTQWQWQDAKPVTRAQLQPGDLVFYFSDLHHMSMYVGGNWVVHAPTTGDVVRMAPLDNPYLPIAGYRRPG